ncbi:MAG: hypothetical protein KC464_34085, partial [Myxococcales bacterium]|nr:hypothetical protein [Myxococcales bacterium]
MRLAAGLFLVPVGLALAACADDPAPSPPEVATVDQAATVCAAGATVAGIDVSYYQGTIDWTAVAGDGIDFAFIRVSDGLTYFDSKFDANWAGARAAGVMRGVYQFFRPGQDPIAQADLLLEHMGTLGPDDLPPVIDVEATDGLAAADVAAGVAAWVAHIEAAIGRPPIIYSGKYFWNDNVRTDALAGYPLWVAQYGPTCPDLPTVWSDWALWQTGSTGRVAGISGNVDTDLFNGDLAALQAFAGVSVACGDAVCSAGETPDSCPADCPPCGVVDGLGGVIDDGDACFTGGGNPDYLRTETDAGYGGSLVWTHATADTAEANYAHWTLHLAEAGHYRIEVYTAAAYAQSRQARYTVRHAGAQDEQVLDQGAVDGWQSLGDFDLAAGGDQWIHLGDDTGEALADNVQLVFDAVRLTRLDPPPPDDGGGDDDPDAAADLGSGCAAAGG